jgi:hypothetical protein
MVIIMDRIKIMVTEAAEVKETKETTAADITEIMEITAADMTKGMDMVMMTKHKTIKVIRALAKCPGFFCLRTSFFIKLL